MTSLRAWGEGEAEGLAPAWGVKGQSLVVRYLCPKCEGWNELTTERSMVEGGRVRLSCMHCTHGGWAMLEGWNG